MVRGRANGRAIGGRMRVRSVGAHRHVHRHRNAGPIRGRENAVVCELRPRDFFQTTSQRLPHAHAIARTLANRDIHFPSGFFRRAEAAVRQYRFHVLAGLSRDGDFES